MHCQGVAFQRADLAIRDILEQIMEQPECQQPRANQIVRHNLYWLAYLPHRPP